jgi:hypothetical protein
MKTRKTAKGSEYERRKGKIKQQNEIANEMGKGKVKEMKIAKSRRRIGKKGKKKRRKATPRGRKICFCFCCVFCCYPDT